ncbi:MAG TPA: PKD domain-containing protein [Micromonosporaceae bacterium]|nr:PKD domain-containing protein [Micromonosporaceae bacterium]
MKSRLLIVALTTVILLPAAPAQAEPTPAAEPSVSAGSPADEPRVTITAKPAPARPGEAGAGSAGSSAAADFRAAQRGARLRWQQRQAAAGIPDGQRTAAQTAAAVALCRDEPLSYYDGGFVIDHYQYCLARRFEITVEVCAFRVPLLGCLRDKTIGEAEFRITTHGHGWDGSMTRPPEDPTDPRYTQISFTTDLDEWDGWGAALAAVLKVEMRCIDKTVGAFCRSHPFERGTSQTVAEWMVENVGPYFRFLADPTEGEGLDQLSYWGFEHVLTLEGPDPDSTTVRGDEFRCDTATYLKGSRGCMFHNVESLWTGLDLNSPTHRKASGHVYDALYRPDVTQPRFAGKDIPGSIDSERPLSRLYPAYDRSRYDANRATAVAACRDWWGPDYSQGGQFECDEYPMASTYQGASQAGIHYSARVIDRDDNGEAGRLLGAFYTNQRILHQDEFFVVLTAGSGGSGGGDPIPDRAPTVNAGPDLTGDEGAPIVVAGVAYDIESTPTVGWIVTPGPNVDPGATCAFADAGRTATTLTCTDDGTFILRLTADDGVNPAVSDTATLTLRNVAPALQLAGSQSVAAAVAAAEVRPAGPEPWSVFKTGTAVPLQAPFGDPGSNDTQTCVADWDDGTSDTYPATERGCDRTHTYAHAGMYTIRLTVTDDDTDLDTSTTMVIVYDPDGGFPTAGAHITSPVGALTSQPDTSGELHFQFDPMYRDDDGNPAPEGGKANARLDGTTFDLDSTTLEWLVVTLDDKVAVKGTATIDGRPGYGFVAYGYDDGPDSYRLVVWPLSAGPYPGEQTLYDNRPDGDYDLDRATPQPLTGGSIQVHQN